MPNRQVPLHSGFGPATTAQETLKAINLAGKVAIVTGGYAGIGLEMTRALAEAGATVVVPARNADKARKALRDIKRVEQGELDLLDPGSIDAFAKEFVSSGRPLHMLINNAGIMATPLTRDARGYESQFSANHLGHFQLTLRLLQALRSAQGARVVSLSSRGHQMAEVDLENPVSTSPVRQVAGLWPIENGERAVCCGTGPARGSAWNPRICSSSRCDLHRP